LRLQDTHTHTHKISHTLPSLPLSFKNTGCTHAGDRPSLGCQNTHGRGRAQLKQTKPHGPCSVTIHSLRAKYIDSLLHISSQKQHICLADNIANYDERLTCNLFTLGIHNDHLSVMQMLLYCFGGLNVILLKIN